MKPDILFALSHDNKVATIVFNKPTTCNAFNAEIIKQLDCYIEKIKKNKNILILIIKANGKHFSAGADLTWMQQSIHYTKQQNFKDANKLSKLLIKLYNLNQPIVCAVQGNAYGGALGIIACADIKIATNNCNFCFAETKLGLIPAIISQFILQTMDFNFTKYHMLTAEQFNSQQAKQAGLINKIVKSNNLNKTIENTIKNLLDINPQGIKATKTLLHQQLFPIKSKNLVKCTELMAKLRTSKITQNLIYKFINHKK